MKLALADLKKAVKKIEETSNDMDINIYFIGNTAIIQFKDKYDAIVTVTLYADSTMLPKISKEDFL